MVSVDQTADNSLGKPILPGGAASIQSYATINAMPAAS